MSYRISNDGKGYYHISFEAPTSFEEIFDAIEESESFVGTERELWNITSIDFDYSTEQLENFASRAKNKTTKPRRVAIVATKDLAYGLSRMYSVFREEGNIQVEVFRSEQEALLWLNSPLSER
jgi:hypothetical protein